MRETRAKDDFELESLRLVDRHDLHRVAQAIRRLGVVCRGRQQALERTGDVGEQRLRALQPFVHRLDRLKALNRSTKVPDRLRSLYRRQAEVKQAAHRAALDQDRIRESRDREPARLAQQPFSRDHRLVQVVQLFGGEELHEAWFWPRLGGGGRHSPSGAFGATSP